MTTQEPTDDQSQKPTTTLDPLPLYITIPRNPEDGPIKFTDSFGRDLCALGYCFKDLAFRVIAGSGSFVTFTILGFRHDGHRIAFDLQLGQQANATRLMDGDVDLFQALPIEKFEVLPLILDANIYYRMTVKLMPEDTVEIK